MVALENAKGVEEPVRYLTVLLLLLVLLHIFCEPAHCIHIITFFKYKREDQPIFLVLFSYFLVKRPIIIITFVIIIIFFVSHLVILNFIIIIFFS